MAIWHALQGEGQTLEVENVELRAELERVHADLAYVRESHMHRGLEAQPLAEGSLMAQTDAVAAKEAAEQMRQMAENAETVAFIFEVSYIPQSSCQTAWSMKFLLQVGKIWIP